jgi:hypothetical protein
MKNQLIDSIFEIIQDYHCDESVTMNKERIHTWIDQFNESDREFILTEFLHLLNQGIYLSKPQVKNILWDWIEKLAIKYKYKNLESFIRESIFLKLQADHKSQSRLLNIINDLLQEKLGLSLKDCATITDKNYIYIDDILATGSTFHKNMVSLFSDIKLRMEIKTKNKNFIALFLCVHSWGKNNKRKTLGIHFKNENVFFDEKIFNIYGYNVVENNFREHNQKLNFLYPIKSIDEYSNYLHSIKNANQNDNFAYRSPYTPIKELFFSSCDNRIRFENIFLDKGIEILSQVELTKQYDPKRPLGFTNPSNRTFGTGTMFFTYLNISNTCPLVLWWDNPAHNWQGLFPLKNRGLL